MDLIFSAIIELLIEGSVEASQSKKIPKPLRYFFLILVIVFFVIVIGAIILLGVSILKNNLIGGIIVILIGIFLALMSIIRFRKDYLAKTGETNENNK